MLYLLWQVSKLGMNIQLNFYHLAVSGFHLSVWVVVFQWLPALTKEKQSNCFPWKPFNSYCSRTVYSNQFTSQQNSGQVSLCMQGFLHAHILEYYYIDFLPHLNMDKFAHIQSRISSWRWEWLPILKHKTTKCTRCVGLHHQDKAMHPLDPAPNLMHSLWRKLH